MHLPFNLRKKALLRHSPYITPPWVSCFLLILKFDPVIALLTDTLLLFQSFVEGLKFSLLMPLVYQLGIWSLFSFPQAHRNLLKKQTASLSKSVSVPGQYLSERLGRRYCKPSPPRRYCIYLFIPY